jgi:hypothetical protein
VRDMHAPGNCARHRQGCVYPANSASRSSKSENRPMHSLTGSDYPSRSSESKLFGIEFSYLRVSKKDSIKPRSGQLDSQLFEAEYFADEDSLLVPANGAAIVDSSQLESFRIRELRQVARQSYWAGGPSGERAARLDLKSVAASTLMSARLSLLVGLPELINCLCK